MAIDVKTEPGDTLLHLTKQLYDPKRLERLEGLNRWYLGDPELPGVPRAASQAVKDFHGHSSTNFALLICEAVRERQRIRGIRTSADDDATGDGEAWKLWQRARLQLVAADVHRLKARFGRSYALVSPPAVDEPDRPVVTAEDPRTTVADLDPMRPWIVRAGLKGLHDPREQVSRLYLYRPGRLDVAEVETKGRDGARFNPQSWNWNPDLSADLPRGMMPLIPFEALDGLGEHEPHLKLLRRINYMILQQLTIAVMQAFRQRVVKGLPARDDKGNLIDYTEMFPADPASVWLLPGTGEVWESGQVDLSGVLTAVRDYIRQLAAASRTPMHMLDPSGENQSAEGAALSREGLVFKVEDRNSRDEQGWSRVVTAAYQWLDREVEDVSIIWAPPQRASSSERASAMAQAAAAGLPFRTNLMTFGEFDSAEADRAEVDREDDQVFAQRVAAMKAELDAQTQARAAEATAKAQAAAGVQPAPPGSGAQPGGGAPNGAPASDGTPKPGPGPQKPAQARNGATA